jgi:hypothetical protein
MSEFNSNEISEMDKLRMALGITGEESPEALVETSKQVSEEDGEDE